MYAAVDRLRHLARRARSRARRRAAARRRLVALAEAEQLARRPLRRLVRRAATVARLGGIARERAKDILVRENLAARLVLHELVRRAADAVDRDDPRLAFCVTIDELPRYLEAPASSPRPSSDRSAQERYLNDRVPPFWFEREIPDPSTWTLRADDRPPPSAAGTARHRGQRRCGIGSHPGDARSRVTRAGSNPARSSCAPSPTRGVTPCFAAAVVGVGHGRAAKPRAPSSPTSSASRP